MPGVPRRLERVRWRRSLLALQQLQASGAGRELLAPPGELLRALGHRDARPRDVEDEIAPGAEQLRAAQRRLREPVCFSRGGLGLSICHTIVTGFGGRIDVSSKPGAGTTFRVTLPIEHPAH